MHPADIKAALQKKGLTLVKVGLKLKVDASVVSNVIYGRGISSKVAQHISDVMGTPVSELWPGKYPRLELREYRRAA